tara:strand:- start:1409 stop:1546 length:138 start_codon:yes stop_codon:yes gene_type:complete
LFEGEGPGEHSVGGDDSVAEAVPGQGAVDQGQDDVPFYQAKAAKA